MQVQEIIIVAGENKLDVWWLRRNLRKQGYSSIPCKTAKQVVEELDILPTCDASVPLVIIEPQILRGISDELITELTECALEIPFLLFNDADEQVEVIEIFETICRCRMRFGPEQNPKLAKVLKGTGVEIIYS